MFHNGSVTSSKKFWLSGSSSFYVDERYRGSGGLLFLRFSELGRKWPMFGNSANADAAKLWKARGAVPIPNTDHELLGVLRWKGVIEEGLTRRRAPKIVARTIGASAAPWVSTYKTLKLEAAGRQDLNPLASAQEVMQLPIHNPAPAANCKPRSELHPLALLHGTRYNGRCLRLSQ